MSDESHLHGDVNRAEELRRSAMEKLSAEAKRLKQLSELQALKENRVQVSADLDDLLLMMKNQKPNSPETSGDHPT